MFVTDELLDMVKEQTNLYSAQSTGSSINVTAKDIEKFIGAYFRMGLVRMPSVRSYWESKVNKKTNCCNNFLTESIVRSSHWRCSVKNLFLKISQISLE